MDPRRSPQRIGEAHLADQPANVQRHRWSAAAESRFPAPIRSETGTMPTDHGVRSDDRQCIIHLGKQSADTSQYQSAQVQHHATASPDSQSTTSRIWFAVGTALPAPSSPSKNDLIIDLARVKPRLNASQR